MYILEKIMSFLKIGKMNNLSLIIGKMNNLAPENEQIKFVMDPKE